MLLDAYVRVVMWIQIRKINSATLVTPILLAVIPAPVPLYVIHARVVLCPCLMVLVVALLATLSQESAPMSPAVPVRYSTVEMCTVLPVTLP